jgi:hypothetical protein
MEGISVRECKSNDSQVPFSEFWRPGRIVSLWDMYRYRLHHLWKVCKEAQDEEWLTYLSGERDLNDAAKELGFRHEDFKKIGLRSAMKQCQTMLEFIGKCDRVLKEDQKAEWRILVREYLKRVEEDLSDQIAYVVEARDVDYVIENQFSIESQTAFLKCNFDMVEAGRCLALERFPASVFHLMRIYDAAVKRIGAHYGLVSAPNVGVLLENLKTKFKSVKQDDNQRREVASLIESLDGVRNGTRNPASHSDDNLPQDSIHFIEMKYTPEETRLVFDNMKSLVHKIALIVLPKA